MITSNSRCDCCGFSVQPQAGDDCPHCGYPIDPAKEEQFLESSLRYLQRVAMHGGPNITVTQLIKRYQQRLSHLRSIPDPVLPAALSAQPAQKVNPEIAIHKQISEEASTNVGIQPLSTPDVPPLQTVPSQLAAVNVPSSSMPILPLQPTNEQVFSLRSFLADQTINIIASLGAFLILLGSLSFIITTSNLLLSFIVMLIVHSLFGISGAISYQFRSFHVVAVIYTAIFALQVPLVGFAAYRLVAGHFIELTVPDLVVIVASYAAIAYGWLAISQKFELFAYLYVVSLAILDLAVCSSFHLAYWWWPGMLMLLAFPIVISEARTPYLPQSFAKGVAVLSRPVHLLMVTSVGICCSGILITTLYSLHVDWSSQSNPEIRFAIIYMLLLLLCWNALFVWSTGHTRFGRWLPYLFLACVLASSYAFTFDQTGYALACTAIALLYYGLKRFTPQLLQSFAYLEKDLEWLALVLVALVPWIVSPLLLVQIFTRAYTPSSSTSLVTGTSVVAIVLLLIGLVLTLSVIESHTGLRKTPAGTQSSWCWLLLLSGFILNWTYGIVILSLHAEPAWCFLGLTLILMALAVAVRRFVSVVWSDPLDVLALGNLGLTLLLSLNHGTEYIVALLLGFAVLLHAIALYQWRRDALWLPLIFGVLACQPLLSLPRMLFVLSILLPLILAGVYLLISRYWQTDEVQSQPFGIAFWVWPLLVLGSFYGMALFWHDTSMPISTMQSWMGIPFSVALELAVLALAWYIAAALARIEEWLFIMTVFAVLALLSASQMFWWLVGAAPVLAILGLGISRLAGRSWALPLYGLAMLAGVIMGRASYSQEHLVVAVSALLGFALLVYLIGVAEQTLTMTQTLIWAAAFFACWSVYYSGVHGDYFFPPLVALTCAAVRVGIGLFRLVTHSLSTLAQRHKLLLYVLPWYATAIFAAILTGVYGVLFGVSKPFYSAVPIAMLVYALVAYGVLLLERKAIWLWLVACFSLWGTFLFSQTYSCALPLSTTHFSFLCGAPIYSLTAVVLVSGLLGILCGRLTKSGLEHVQRLTVLRTQYAWSWPWYLTSLVAIGVTITWKTDAGSILPQNIWLSIFDIFIVLWLAIMLVERMPDFLLVVAMLAAYTIAQTLWPTWQVMGAYSLLCVCLFVMQFIWCALPPKVYILSAESLHRIVTIGGLVIVVLGIILQGGLLPHAGMLAHVGSSSLCLLAASLFWYGHVGRLQPLPIEPAIQRLCSYGAGLLPSLVISWEWLAFGQKDLSLLSIAPATYLIVASSFLSRDAVLPQREHLSGGCAISGAIILLLPTLWSSFSQQNLFPALLLASEALLLCLIGFGMRLRFFVLSGVALVIVSGIRILFLPSLGISSFLALTISGGLLLVSATGLMLIRSHLASWG
jgi:hypothetical protein